VHQSLLMHVQNYTDLKIQTKVTVLVLVIEKTNTVALASVFKPVVHFRYSLLCYIFEMEYMQSIKNTYYIDIVVYNLNIKS